MIELRGMAKRYGDRTVVDDLSFRVEPGAVIDPGAVIRARAEGIDGGLQRLRAEHDAQRRRVGVDRFARAGLSSYRA